MKKFFAVGLLLYTVTSLLPLVRSDHWAIRSWDFPRLQLLITGLMLFIPMLVMMIRDKERWGWFLIIPLVGIALDGYRLYPYSPLSKIESPLHAHRSDAFSILTFNVLQDNTAYDKLISLISRESPDYVFLFEVNDDWVKGLESLEGYPVRHYHALDNTYGIGFLSREKVSKVKIRTLIEKDVPSFEVEFLPEKGEKVTIIAVHPKPPKPNTNTDERDAELVVVAKRAKELPGPVLVLGDLNDVAWSHTTRLFRRISGLLDPRVGRRPYTTFPSVPAPFRFPLDYIFHSEELKLTRLEVLQDIESDHLPLLASFYVAEPDGEESLEKPEADDQKEAQEILEKGTDGE